MKVFVINLPSSSERLVFMNKQLQKLNIADVHIFSAINGHELPERFRRHLNPTLRKLAKGCPFLPGELGVWASNYALWEKCVELNEPILVMEDDIELTEDFLNSYQKAEYLHKKGYEYFTFASHDYPAEIVDNEQGIVHWRKNGSGSTLCYSISPQGAEKLLNSASIWIGAVDNYVGQAYKTKVPSLGLLPCGARVFEDLNAFSTIQHNGKKAKEPVLYRVTSDFYRSYVNLRRTIWNGFLSNGKLKKLKLQYK